MKWKDEPEWRLHEDGLGLVHCRFVLSMEVSATEPSGIEGL